MNILAVDTSALTATVSIMKDNVSVYEHNVTNALTHSETLMPMIDTALKSLNLTTSDIDLYAVSAGPGSFTGIRIGVAAIKALAYAVNKPVFPMSTLKALAYNLSTVENTPICAIMDARRGQVYTGTYIFENGCCRCIFPPDAISIEELCEKITEKTYFVGDGVPVYHDLIVSLLDEKVEFAPPGLLLQKASSVAYAASLATKDEYCTPEATEVIYLRKSQAEREREEKERNE